MKRIAICMDGTWQRLSRDDATNIAVIARSVAHHAIGPKGEEIAQIVIYSRGVGAVSELSETGGGLTGGLFGEGLEDSLLDTYLRLAFNYEVGDELYIFGFSRGAFAARSLAGLIARCGIVSRRHAERAPEAFRLYRNPNLDATSEEVVRFREETGKRIYVGDGSRHSFYRQTIKYLGVFDTVGQRGMPSVLGPISDWMNRKYAFHNLSLSRAVESARHALAADETRWLFPPTPWDNLDALNEEAHRHAKERSAPLTVDPYQQLWFAGTHGDVGGGRGADLAAIPLEWIVDGAAHQGLVFDMAPESRVGQALRGKDPGARSVRPRGPDSLRPDNWTLGARRVFAKPPAGRHYSPEETLRLVHPSVVARIAQLRAAGRAYRPAALGRFARALKELAAKQG